MKTILHISADFPDPVAPNKTKAVANLIAETPGFHHVVYSLNRRMTRGVSMTRFDSDHAAITYGAPPYGIGLKHFLRPVAAMIQQDVRARGLSPDLIHAHKFSVEGLIAAELAGAHQTPFVCSLWGDTDIRIFNVKRGLRSSYRSIAASAEQLLPAAPWTGDYFRNALELPDHKFNVLPVMTAADATFSPSITGGSSLVSLFHLDSWRRKGFEQLVRAAVTAAADIEGLTIDVYGTGSARSVKAMQAIINRHRASSIVRLMGSAPHDQVQTILNGYTGFVMAPHRETYGMVHVEALLAGLPILWSKDRGVDGFFESQDVGYRADPTSVKDIAQGMRLLVEREQSLKVNIAHLQRNGAFDHLRRHSIAQTYTDILMRHADPAPEERRIAS